MKRGWTVAIVIAIMSAYWLKVPQEAQAGREPNQAQAEAQAIAALTRLKIPLQRDPKGIVRWIEAVDGELSDEALAHVARLSRLEWLEIGGGAVTAAGVSNLKHCVALKRLYIHGVKLNGDELAWLASLKNLEALSLQGTGVDGRVVNNLKTLDALKVLNLSDNSINDADMERIAGLRKLEVLSLANTKITGAGIAHLNGMTSLNELNIMDCQIIDPDLEHFLSMPNLRIVYAAGCSITDLAIHTVVSRFPMLAIFR
jgi:hypothetical protein